MAGQKHRMARPSARGRDAGAATGASAPVSGAAGAPALARGGVTQAMANTGLHIPIDLLERLRMVAVRRSTNRGGGRPSVSEVLVDLAERHIEGLEREVGLK